MSLHGKNLQCNGNKKDVNFCFIFRKRLSKTYARLTAWELTVGRWALTTGINTNGILRWRTTRFVRRIFYILDILRKNYYFRQCEKLLNVC